MSRCEWTESCPFFNTEVGFSPDLNKAMRERYCLGDNEGCIRMEAFHLIPFTRIPDDLIPTDTERLDVLVQEFYDEVCAKHCKRD